MAIKTNSITDQAGTGAPDFPNGFNSTGMKHLEFYKSGGTTSIVDNTATDIVFDTEVTNTFSTEYNNSTGIFTASEAGLYLIQTTIGAEESASGDVNRCLSTFVKNGSNFIRFGELRNINNQGWRGITLSGSHTISLAASDTLKVTMQMDTDGGATWTILGNAVGSTFLSITKIG